MAIFERKHLKYFYKYSQKLIFILFLFFSTSTFNAFSTDKTFYAHRPNNENILLELPLNNQDLYKYPSEKIYLTTFGEMTINHAKLAEYLMFDNRSSLNIGRNTDIDNRYLKFNETSATNLSGTIKLKPKIETLGVFLSYHQPLYPISKNLFLRINLPLVYTRFNPNLKVLNGTSSSVDDKNITDYFKGDIMLERYRPGESQPRILQNKLEYGKISKTAITKTSLADINLMLSFKTTKRKNFLLNFNGIAIIPTNSTPRSEWMMEPTIGTAGHWALGVGIDGAILAKKHLQFVYDLRYKYILKADERRILGLKNSSGTKLKWEPYMLIGTIGSATVTPAANILGQMVQVKPGSRFESLLMLSYDKNNFAAQFGYDFWFKEMDHVTPVRNWENNKYAFAGSDYLDSLMGIVSSDNSENGAQVNSIFKLQNSNLINTINKMYPAGTISASQGTISGTQIDESEAVSPSVISHKLFLSLGYTWNKKNKSYFLGGGSSIELPISNAQLIQLGLWLKFGIVF